MPPTLLAFFRESQQQQQHSQPAWQRVAAATAPQSKAACTTSSGSDTWDGVISAADFKSFVEVVMDTVESVVKLGNHPPVAGTVGAASDGSSGGGVRIRTVSCPVGEARSVLAITRLAVSFTSLKATASSNSIDSYFRRGGTSSKPTATTPAGSSGANGSCRGWNNSRVNAASMDGEAHAKLQQLQLPHLPPSLRVVRNDLAANNADAAGDDKNAGSIAGSAQSVDSKHSAAVAVTSSSDEKLLQQPPYQQQQRLCSWKFDDGDDYDLFANNDEDEDDDADDADDAEDDDYASAGAEVGRESGGPECERAYTQTCRKHGWDPAVLAELPFEMRQELLLANVSGPNSRARDDGKRRKVEDRKKDKRKEVAGSSTLEAFGFTKQAQNLSRWY